MNFHQKNYQTMDFMACEGKQWF